MSEITERVCTKCGPPAQPIENFGWKDRLRGKRHAVCKTCTAKRSSNWYYENQDRQKENVKLNNQQYPRTPGIMYLSIFLHTHAVFVANLIQWYLSFTT